MKIRLPSRALPLIILACTLGPGLSRAEVVEDIVAWVNGDIITKSDYDMEAEIVVADAKRRFTGEQLDLQVKQIREGLLLQMIDRKILVDRAKRLYDITKMEQVFYEQFKEQQHIDSDEEFERLLAQEGMTVDQLRRRLVEMFAPEEVVRLEIRSRLAVGDKEVQAYYDAHSEQFAVDAEVTFREIVLLAESEDRRAARRSEAADIRQRLQSGADFAELAKQVSEAGSKDDGGLVGPLKRADLGEHLNQALTLPVGEVSEVLESPHGLHIIRVESRSERTIKPLEEVREGLRRQLEERRYREELKGFLEKARAEAEWCVKPRYKNLLSVPSPESCERL